MKKHDLYFDIKKNLIFSLLNLLSKSFYALSKWMDKLQKARKLISSRLNAVD